MAARKKFTGKVRRGLYLLCNDDSVAAVLTGKVRREETKLTARQLGDARAAELWVLGELNARREFPFGDRGSSNCCPCKADFNFTCICTQEEIEAHNRKD